MPAIVLIDVPALDVPHRPGLAADGPGPDRRLHEPAQAAFGPLGHEDFLRVADQDLLHLPDLLLIRAIVPKRLPHAEPFGTISRHAAPDSDVHRSTPSGS